MDQNKEHQLEDARDALKHIISAVGQSRSQTRRLRWIEVRARDGLDGTTEHQRVNLPKSTTNAIDERMKTVKAKKELEAAKARIAELEKALEPFADLVTAWSGPSGGLIDQLVLCNREDVRRAAELLEKK